MRKSLLCAILILCILCLAGCGSAVTIGGLSSKYFNGDAHEEAVREVQLYFDNFEGCTLKRIDYAGDAAVKAEADARGIVPERVMVLETTFTTDGENHENGLEPNYTYEHYKWILTRDTTFTPWIVTDHGYN